MTQNEDNSLNMRRGDVYEFYRDVHGFKPRHIKWDKLSSEELDSIEDELIAISNSDWHKQKMQDESDDLDHELLLYKYQDEDDAKDVGDHPDDFYDTMNFGKDKAKLRDFNPRLESIVRRLVAEHKKKAKTTKSELKRLITNEVSKSLKEQTFSREDGNVRVEDAVEGLEMAIFDLKKAVAKLGDQELRSQLKSALGHARAASEGVEKYIRLKRTKSDAMSVQSIDDNYGLRSQRDFDRVILGYGIEPSETTADNLYQTLVEDGFVDPSDSSSVDAAEAAVAEFMGEY